jgi:hypothetical protein
MPPLQSWGGPMLVARCVVSWGATALAGCAAVVTADAERLQLTSPEFRAYVERVFREQNRVADELAFALATDSNSPAQRLEGAEQTLLVACAGINELATARRDSQSLGLRRSAELARGVPECERATRAATTALSQKD